MTIEEIAAEITRHNNNKNIICEALETLVRHKAEYSQNMTLQIKSNKRDMIISCIDTDFIAELFALGYDNSNKKIQELKHRLAEMYKAQQ